MTLKCHSNPLHTNSFFPLQFPMSRSLGIEISLLSLLPQSNYAVSCHKVWSRRLISNGGTTITICLWPPQLSALEMSKGQDYKPHHQSILLKALRSALWPSCTLRLQIRGHILACRLSWSQLLSAFTFWKVSQYTFIILVLPHQMYRNFFGFKCTQCAMV